MPEQVLTALGAGSVAGLIAMLGLYLLKGAFERMLDQRVHQQQKQLEHGLKQVEELNKAGLSVAQEMRGEARKAIVAFPVKLFQWEHAVRSMPGRLATADPMSFDPNPIFEQDEQLFFEVQESCLQACLYLRNAELEDSCMNIISELRALYQPTLHTYTPQIVELQVELGALMSKMEGYSTGRLPIPPDYDVSVHGQQDLARNRELNAQLTETLEKWRASLLETYQPFAEKMADLRLDIRSHIYRPISASLLDADPQTG